MFLLACIAWSMAAQPGLAQPAGTPTADGWPDIQGVWRNVSGIHLDRFTVVTEPDPRAQREFRPADPPYNAEYAARYRAVREAHARGESINDPTAACVWPGVPRVLWSPYPIEIVIAADGHMVLMLHEYMSQVRRIHLDGRAHPEDPPSPRTTGIRSGIGRAMSL